MKTVGNDLALFSIFSMGRRTTVRHDDDDGRGRECTYGQKNTNVFTREHNKQIENPLTTSSHMNWEDMIQKHSRQQAVSLYKVFHHHKPLLVHIFHTVCRAHHFFTLPITIYAQCPRTLTNKGNSKSVERGWSLLFLLRRALYLSLTSVSFGRDTRDRFGVL